MSQARIKRSKIRVEVENTRLQNLQMEIDNFDEMQEDDFFLLNKMDKLKNIKLVFNENIDYLLDVVHSQDELRDITNQLIQFEQKCDIISITIHRLMPKANQPIKANADQEPRNNMQIKLPDIKLPTFGGKYEDWVDFKDDFERIVSQNRDLSDFQKLYYLKSVLHGEAATLKSSNDTFQSLWDELLKRFEKRRIILDKVINNMLDFPSINRESSSDLRSLITEFSRSVRVFRKMNMETSQLNEMFIVTIILNKIDKESRRQFEMAIKKDDIPTFDLILDFLENRFHVLENLEKSKSLQPKTVSHAQSKPTHQYKSTSSRSNALLINDSKLFSPVCNKSHYINKCEQFLQMSNKERYELVRKVNLCQNCLSRSHNTGNCRSSSCRKCSQRHHTLLHDDSCSVPSGNSPDQTITQPKSESIQSGSSMQNKTSLSTFLMATSHEILLSTIVLMIYDNNNEPHYCRAILDSGSQQNFMTENLAQVIRTKRNTTSALVYGINQHPTTIIGRTSALIRSRTSNYSTKCEFSILNKISCPLPGKRIETDSLQIPAIQLADPDFNVPQRVDMLLGIQIFCDIWLNNQIHLGLNQPVLFETKFGWVVSGKCKLEVNVSGNQFCGLTVTNEDLLNEMKKFWEVET